MFTSLAPAEAFAEAVRLAGGQTATARALGVTQGAIWQRLKGGKPAAEGWVLRLEAATGVSKHDLRPDLYPRETIAVPAVVDPEIAR